MSYQVNKQMMGWGRQPEVHTSTYLPTYLTALQVAPPMRYLGILNLTQAPLAVLRRLARLASDPGGYLLSKMTSSTAWSAEIGTRTRSAEWSAPPDEVQLPGALLEHVFRRLLHYPVLVRTHCRESQTFHYRPLLTQARLGSQATRAVAPVLCQSSSRLCLITMSLT